MTKSMKKAVSMASVLTLTLSMIPTSFAAAESTTDYIPAPYSVEDATTDETTGTSVYLDPVFYENEDGPTIGVTLVGVIVEDGLYFKDSDNDGELDAYEDWRLTTEERMADLYSKMTDEQKLGVIANQLICSPSASSAEDAYDEDGNVVFSSLITVTEDAFDMYLGLETETYANSTGEMLTYKSRAGVLRKTLDGTVSALWTNALAETTEYDAVVSGEPTIPFTVIANPQSITDAPGTLGMAAAVMGDVANGGDYSLIEEFSTLDGIIWYNKGINRMYGPQIDLVTDPRWSRDSTTYTEVPEVMAGIATALVTGYQNGTDGVQEGDVALIVKHFPGDGSSYNGFESHYWYGAYRIYATEGSLETYQLVGFQAAIDAGVAGIMPGYSMQAADGVRGSVDQTVYGVEITADEIANAYSSTILQTLLKDTMGFDGLVNTDSTVVSSLYYGAEDMTEAERIAYVINAGSDVIGDWFYSGIDWENIYEAFNQGLIEDEALERAVSNTVSVSIDQGLFENPYKDVETSATVVEETTAALQEVADEANLKSVVLMKNSNDVLPLADTSKTVYIASFTNSGSNETTEESWAAAFEAAGYTIVSSYEEADIAYLDVYPGGIANGNDYMAVLDLVDGLEVDQYDTTTAQKTGDTVEVTTLQDVKKIAKIAEAVHENGGIVIASINISNPWILTNLEPYCDALLGSFDTSVAARMAVLSGEYNPTGVLPVTMVSCDEVIAVVDAVDENGDAYEACVSPNDVPGYDKDQYIDEEVLAQSPSGSYAYMDADGNYYTAWFGLSYAE